MAVNFRGHASSTRDCPKQAAGLVGERSVPKAGETIIQLNRMKWNDLWVVDVFEMRSSYPAS